MDMRQDILESFLAVAANAAVFLDVDGVLVPIAETPGEVTVEADLLEKLLALGARLNGAVALVSGRSLADLDRLFAPHSFAAAGLHGLERRDSAGHIHEAPAMPELAELRPVLAAFVRQNPGTMVEDKGSAIALHYRRAPQAYEAARALMEFLVAPRRSSLALVPGKMVFEVKPLSADKGVAIAGFMSEPPFQGRKPIFIGDDVNDEDGFGIVNDLGGLSVRVGSGTPTAALTELPDVESVDTWLNRLLAAAGSLEAGPAAQ